MYVYFNFSDFLEFISLIDYFKTKKSQEKEKVEKQVGIRTDSLQTVPLSSEPNFKQMEKFLYTKLCLTT